MFIRMHESCTLLMISFPGTDHLKKISCVNLRYVHLEHSNWLKIFEPPIRMLKEASCNFARELFFIGSGPGLAPTYYVLGKGLSKRLVN